MKTELRVIGLLLAATALAVAEMRTWTFEKSGKTMEGEVVAFADDAVILKRFDFKRFSVPIAYLTESDRAYLKVERADQWKDVEIVRIEEASIVGHTCIVRPARIRMVSDEIMVRLLPVSVEAILNERKKLAAQVAEADKRVGVRRVVEASGTVHEYEYGQTDLLNKARRLLTEYISKTQSARTVKMRNTGRIASGLEVWACYDPRKRQQ